VILQPFREHGRTGFELQRASALFLHLINDSVGFRRFFERHGGDGRQKVLVQRHVATAVHVCKVEVGDGEGAVHVEDHTTQPFDGEGGHGTLKVVVHSRGESVVRVTTKVVGDGGKVVGDGVMEMVMGGLDRNLSLFVAGKKTALPCTMQAPGYQVKYFFVILHTRYHVPVVGPGCTFSVVNGRSSTIPPMPHECSIHTQN
jgi:hypothetical protein